MKKIIFIFAVIGMISAFTLQKTSTEVSIFTDPTQCIQEKCPTQYAACQKDSKCPATLQKCEDKCKTDQNCWKFCLVGAGNQPAIDVAKCAAANNCLSTQVYAFETCMQKSCSSHFDECLGDKLCRLFLLKCRIPEKVWEFNLDCLNEKVVFHPRLASFYACAGENKCL